MAFTAWSIYLKHDTTITRTVEGLGRTAQLTAKWIDYSFRVVHQVGSDVALLLSDTGQVGGADLDRAGEDPQLAAALTARTRVFTRVKAILVVDTAGNSVVASTHGTGPHDDAAIRHLIAGLAIAPSERAMLLAPAFDGGTDVVYVAVRLADAAGALTGAIVLVFDPAWFASILSEIERSMPVRLSLDFRDETGNGQRLVTSRLAGDANVEMVSASADAGGLGLTVTAARPRAEALDSWMRQAWSSLGILSLWELAVLAGYLAVRRWQRVVRRAQEARTSALAATKKAEEEARCARIREAERAIEAIFDNEAVGFAEVALPGERFIRVNRRYCEICGRSAADLLGGLGPNDIYHPDDLATFVASNRLLEEKGSVERTVRYVHPDGTQVWVHIGVKVAAVDNRGNPIRLIAVVQDISDIKRASEEARERETLLRLSMQVGHVGAFWRRHGEDLLHVSDETCSILGLPEGTRLVPYASLERHMPESDRLRIRGELSVAFAKREAEKAFGFRFVRPLDGVARLLEVRVRNDYDAEGRQRSTGVLIDVTETRKAEALLRLSLQISRIGTFRHDFATQLVSCDATTRELHGLPPDGRPIPKDDWWGLILPEDRKSLEAGLATDAAVHADDSRRDYRIRRADDGSIRHITARVHLEYGSEGELASANGVVIDMSDRYEAEARIAHLARHDVLTDLPNRIVLRERAEAAAAMSRRGQAFALMMIDLDHFKHVNDTLGHSAGDHLLQAVARRLSECVRETDTVARLGGDEFAVLMPALGEPRDAAAIVAERIVASLGRPFQIGDHTVEIGSSVGIAVAPLDGNDIDDITKAADLALYRAKADGRGCWRFFEAAMDTDMRRRHSGEFELRRALRDDDFDLLYQPMIDLGSDQTIGVEAQMVWRHPERGVLPAEAFASLAEELGLLKDIGARLLARACAEAATWAGTPLLAFPISSRQFYDRAFVFAVSEALAEARLPAERLELRMSEATLTAPNRDPLVVLAALSGVGVGLAIADIGSGRSLIGLLARQRFDRLILDGARLGRGADDDLAAIAATMTRLGDGHGTDCAMTGVDVEGRERLVERSRFSVAQGRLYAMPMRSNEIRSHLLGEFASRRRVV